MKKGRKILSYLLTCLFLFTLIQVPFNVNAEESNEPVYVKIRYSRGDSQYESWNLWVWEKGKDGKQVDFFGVDSEGAYAVVETTKKADTLGFIVRKNVNGNDWAEKDTNDVYIDLSKGNTEVVVNNSNGAVSVNEREIKLDFNKLTVNLHYFRFDSNYDNWDVWAWLGKNPGNNYTFASDEFGTVTNFEFANVGKDENPGFIIRRPNWSQKDYDDDRFINKIYANADGILNAYVVTGEEKVYYNPNDVVKDPKIISAKIDTLNNISFKTNTKIKDSDIATKVTLTENGNNIPLSNVSIDDGLISGAITTENSIDLNNKYVLNIEGFGSKELTLGKIYDSEDFSKLFTYNGELCSVYSKEKTKFILWAPTAKDVKLALYGTDGKSYNSSPTDIINMTKGENGTWLVEVPGDLNGVYYNYKVEVNGSINEVTDPYAKALGVNGNRGMVIDLSSTNPVGWEVVKKPELKDPTDSIIYEMHIRDFSIDKNSGVSLKYQGKYNGVWQPNTTIPGTDVKTGVEHLKELGVTTVQLLPSFDHRSIDESKLDTPQFNWGYDPQNYNAPEGSYSSDPYTGEIRIKEFKEMVNELHKAGIRVVMDVVYNHTGASLNSNLNLAVPDYYYRQNEDGTFSNASGCGNETASDRSMVRKLIVDSVVYWANEYHIDGFRFDLMAIHDIDTMKEVRSELNKIDPSIIVYGEGWTGGATPLSSDKQALKANMPSFGDLQIGAFSDDIRDGVKGHVFDSEAPGFVNGGQDFEETVKFGVVASTKNNQVDYSKVKNNTKPWANQPYQTISYVSAHDNLTLWDKLQTTNKNATTEELLSMNKMAAAIVYTSQGIPFMQAGEEFARTKLNPDGTFNENSYNAPDSVNQIDWTRKVEYNDLFQYYKGLITLRKSHKAFRMNSTTDIQNNLNFLDVADKNVVAYTLNGTAVGDNYNKIAVIYNANNSDVEVTLPSNDWVILVNGEKAGIESLGSIEGNVVKVKANSSYVLVDKDSYLKEGNEENPDIKDNEEQDEDTGVLGSSDISEETKTSDNNNLLAYASLLVLASVSLVVLKIKSRKNN
ncbi:MAG: type I pullulanase [Clostridiales bacterium]|nr:type I pullulanase [Clostridiales bacterium]